MGIRLVVCGGRDVSLGDSEYAFLDSVIERLGVVDELLSGGCRGVDCCAEAWARARGIPVRRFVADWKSDGSFAISKQHRAMACLCDVVIAFRGGFGTSDMVRCASDLGIPVIFYEGS